jgi:hypothetical protein
MWTSIIIIVIVIMMIIMIAGRAAALRGLLARAMATPDQNLRLHAMKVR